MVSSLFAILPSFVFLGLHVLTLVGVCVVFFAPGFSQLSIGSFKADLYTRMFVYKATFDTVSFCMPKAGFTLRNHALNV